MSQDPLRPRDHAEAVALFRAEIVGAICHRELSRGELALAIRTLAACRYRPPGRRASKQFGAHVAARLRERDREGVVERHAAMAIIGNSATFGPIPR